MKILHVVPCADETNGIYRVARMLAEKQSGDGHESAVVTVRGFSASSPVDEVWVHGMWLPRVWRACGRVLKARIPLVRMTHGSLSPVYLERQGKWKKRLVAPIERWLFARTARVVATGAWEEAWCRRWMDSIVTDSRRTASSGRPLREGPKIETVDLKQFFDLEGRARRSFPWTRNLFASSAPQSLPCAHVLYLGRRHPLKGVQFLERAVREINEEGAGKVDLRIVSDARGEALEKVWAWCDVLCLPTLSENFGLVVAEALERGKFVITTDGAPAWEPPKGSGEVEVEVGGRQWWNRLLYLRGYRDGTDEVRVNLLKQALRAHVS